jgi:glutaconyl-CoA/methylmalonyl-CoA decarboxylase subunit gamma
MRRYTIAVGGRSFALDVRELSADRFEVRLENRVLDVQLVTETDLPSAVISPEMATALGQPAGAVVQTEAPSRTQTGAAVAPAPLPRPGLTNTASIATSRTLTAPMPGAIVSIDVAPGTRVKRGEVLLTLEAMKMMNAIRAPRDAVVSEVVVSAGQTVAFGDALMRFEG